MITIISNRKVYYVKVTPINTNSNYNISVHLFDTKNNKTANDLLVGTIMKEDTTIDTIRKWASNKIEELHGNNIQTINI
jgi:hypothetical protein